jgi:steroid 5-alpha reductase family enzyme
MKFVSLVYGSTADIQIIFFEWITWCSYPFFFLNDISLFITALITPAVVFWLLNYFSGIPPLEATALKNKGERYAQYMQKTSKFFPWMSK